MSMTKEYIKKFVEEDYKDCVILVTCDNEHKFYHNAANNPPIIWDWNNGTFKVLQSNQEITDQYGNPFQIVTVALEEIQFLEAYVSMETALDFINENVTDEEKKKECKEKFIQKLAGCTMAPNSLSEPKGYQYGTPIKRLKIGETVDDIKS